jgi:hypothetical protein
LLLHRAGQKRGKAAEQTGFVKTYISELVSRYCKQGISVITGENCRGNRRNLSYAAKEILLESFKKVAAAGQTVEISQIKRVHKKAIGTY